MDTTPRRSGARTRLVSRLVGPLAGLALVAGLTACGADAGDDSASDPAASEGSPSSPSSSDTPSETPTEEPGESGAPGSMSGGAGPIEATGSAGVTEAQLVSQTEGGGSASEMAFALDTDRAVSDFVAGLQNGFDATVTDAVARVRRDNPDATPYGAVVGIGCEAPRGVAIDAGEAGFMVVPQVPKSSVQCFAPQTFVVVFAAPNA